MIILCFYNSFQPKITNMATTNIAIIGLGNMAATHIKAFQKIQNVRITALCNPSGKQLDGDFSKIAGNIGDNGLKLDMKNIKATRNPKEIFEDPEIHVVDICSPTTTHLLLCRAALEAGKHVICEKPLCRTSLEAKILLEVASKAQLFLFPALCIRFWPEWQYLKDLIISNKHGNVLSARFHRISAVPWWGDKYFLNGEQSGGALLDLHIHDSDFVRFCFGDPQRVFSSGYSKVSGEIDHVVTQYLYTSGPCVYAEGTWAVTRGYPFNMTYRVDFEQATIDYDMSRGDEALKVYKEGSCSVIKCSGDGYFGQLKYFIDCVHNNTAPTVVTMYDGMRVLELIEAEAKSIRDGIPISFSE
jgi:predicted dehydrogenase